MELQLCLHKRCTTLKKHQPLILKELSEKPIITRLSLFSQTLIHYQASKILELAFKVQEVLEIVD
jgi:hypothetical protein